MTRLAVFLVALSMALTPAWAERPRPLGWAMDAVRDGDWDAAKVIAQRDGAIAADVIEWQRLRQGLGTWSEVDAFLNRRPDWPGERLLRRRSEAVVTGQPRQTILAFFAEEPAQTPQGVLAHAAALRASGEIGLSDALIVEAWRTLDMSAENHARFLEAHRTLLASHHNARLDALLWQSAFSAAERMYPLVSEGHVALAKARIALRKRAGNVDALIAAVPADLRSAPGLAHDRYEWRIRKGLWDSAKALLLERSTSVTSLGDPQAWANRRRALARDEMRDGNARRAYQMASQHFLTEGSAYADLEWLSGFIALRLLNDPSLAAGHFNNHRLATKSPISQGRAGYWLGRAFEAAGDTDAAQTAYALGARFQTSFYGLLAAERGGFPFDQSLAGEKPSADWRQSAMAKDDVFQAGLLLQASGERSLAERFWTHYAERLIPQDAALLGQAAIDTGQPHLAVMIGKRVARSGVTLAAPYYALHPLTELNLNMAPEMALAIARRESEFDPNVQSGVGARGLMQIMPGTGQDVARDLGLASGHSTARLISDPTYNALLGAEYLAQLAARFDGNVVMMSAGYNAGPARPTRWMETYGDPRRRNSESDIVDWIEMIPFRETRNYVMRVTESLPVYRARLGKEPLPIPFSQELTGSTLKAFSPKGE